MLFVTLCWNGWIKQIKHGDRQTSAIYGQRDVWPSTKATEPSYCTRGIERMGVCTE